MPTLIPEFTRLQLSTIAKKKVRQDNSLDFLVPPQGHGVRFDVVFNNAL